MPTKISWVNSVIIDAPQSLVYEYITDLSKDPTWRLEVNKMDVKGEVKIGTIAVEYSSLFMGLMKIVTSTEAVTLDKPNLCVFETVKDAETWLISHRELKALDKNKTEFIYRLETEVAVSGVIGSIYAKLLTKIYQPRLPKYLNILKNIIEKQVTTT